MSKTIRLFIDAHTFDHEYQGSRTYLKEIYSRFPDDDKILLYFAANDIDNLKAEIGEQANFRFIKYKSHSRIMRLGIELPRLLRSLKIDYAHFQYIAPPVKVCKYIITTHDVIFHDFPEEFSFLYKLNKHILYRIAALQASILTTVSEFSKRSIHKYFKIKLDKIHVIHNAVGDEYFENYEKELLKKYISEKYGVNNYVLVVSRIEPRKNHVALVNAFKSLSLFAKGFQMVFIGTESIMDEKLNTALGALTAEERSQYHHLEGIDYNDLIKFYSAATLCIYPSKGEGFGIPPLESAALQTPTLCSSVSAMSDFDFFNEFLFDPADQNDFETKLLNILNNGVSSKRLHEISDAIKEKYSWNKSSKELYNLILSKHS